MPKDKNASNGKTYDDVNSIKANFTYKDRIFDLDLLYNYEGGENYTILYSYTEEGFCKSKSFSDDNFKSCQRFFQFLFVQ